MRILANFGIGAGGTAVTISLHDAAAVFAGICTGVWMITQTVIAIRNHLSKTNQDKPQ